MDQDGKVQIEYYQETHIRVSNRVLLDFNYEHFGNNQHSNRRRRSNDTVDYLKMFGDLSLETFNLLSNGLKLPEGLEITQTNPPEVRKTVFRQILCTIRRQRVIFSN